MTGSVKPNPFLKKLGFSENTRAVILHTDDIGMCQAAVQAYRDLWAFGTITSGAVMVPCPWFQAVARMCQENPAMDMGVHATLNAEWADYRWGPVSFQAEGSGLLDEQGYLHRSREAVFAHARPEEVEKEVNAQVEKALKAGIDVTHVDTHMGTIMNPAFIQSYIQAAAGRLLPSMLPRLSAVGIEMMGVGEAEKIAYAPFMEMFESMGIPMLDGLMSMPLDHARDHIGFAKKLVGELPAGITHLLFHPSIDSPELRAICPDWPARVANYNAFMSDELKKFLETEDIKLIGYRHIREAMRG